MDEQNGALQFLAQKLSIRDLTAEARAGTLPQYVVESQTSESLTGSSGNSLFTAAARVLFRKDRRHLLLTGWKGVGKTAAAWELGRLAATNQFQFLSRHRFIWIDATFVGPEDSRACLESILLATQDIRPLVLCIDGLHSLLRRPNGGSNKPLLRASLNDSDLSLIGILPRWEYSELFSADAEMLDVFERLEIDEPDDAAATEIVGAVAEELSQQYQLQISPNAVQRAVSLTGNFMLSQRLPQKAVKVLRQACDDVAFARNELRSPDVTVDVDNIVSVVSRQTEIPASTLKGHASDRDWEKALSSAVVGQSRAVQCVADELRLIKAGLNDPGRPASVLLFAGMTGVGKTELAKRLAELYSASHRLQMYSMANFTEGHSVSGIVGVPAGYVGHEQGGRLINDLNSDPYSVFLLDEAEKAHPNVWKPFLNLFDEGWIVDQRGARATADRAIFVLTTNAGSDEIDQMTRSNRPVEEIEQRVTSILSRVRAERGSQPVFPPQFLARLKRIVIFQPLDHTAMLDITKIAIDELRTRWLSRREQKVVFDQPLVDWIGFEADQLNQRSGGREGGRAVRKIITTHVESRLAVFALDDLNKPATDCVLKLRLSSESEHHKVSIEAC